MSYVVTAPLVVAARRGGTLGYFYQGQPIPWLSTEDAQRLLADGLIANADTPVTVESASTEAGGTGAAVDRNGMGVPVSESSGTAAIERPDPTSPKAEWIEYGVSAGLDRTEAEAMTKAQIDAAVEARRAGA